MDKDLTFNSEIYKVINEFVTNLNNRCNELLGESTIRAIESINEAVRSAIPDTTLNGAIAFLESLKSQIAINRVDITPILKNISSMPNDCEDVLISDDDISSAEILAIPLEGMCKKDSSGNKLATRDTVIALIGLLIAIICMIHDFKQDYENDIQHNEIMQKIEESYEVKSNQLEELKSINEKEDAALKLLETISSQIGEVEQPTEQTTEHLK